MPFTFKLSQRLARMRDLGSSTSAVALAVFRRWPVAGSRFPACERRLPPAPLMLSLLHGVPRAVFGRARVALAQPLLRIAVDASQAVFS